MLIKVMCALTIAFTQWRARQEAADILSQLNVQQLKEMGMSRNDVGRWR